VRFMAMKDEAAWKMGRNIACVWTVLGYSGAILIGLVGLAIFPCKTDDCRLGFCRRKNLFSPLSQKPVGKTDGLLYLLRRNAFRRKVATAFPLRRKFPRPSFIVY